MDIDEKIFKLYEEVKKCAPWDIAFIDDINEVLCFDSKRAKRKCYKILLKRWVRWKRKWNKYIPDLRE